MNFKITMCTLTEKTNTSQVTKAQKDICFLIEQGFEYVTDFEGVKIF